MNLLKYKNNRCEICGYTDITGEGDGRDFYLDCTYKYNTSRVVCQECCDSIFDALMEFEVVDEQDLEILATIAEDGRTQAVDVLATPIATTPYDPAVASNLGQETLIEGGRGATEPGEGVRETQ